MSFFLQKFPLSVFEYSSDFCVLDFMSFAWSYLLSYWQIWAAERKWFSFITTKSWSKCAQLSNYIKCTLLMWSSHIRPKCGTIIVNVCVFFHANCLLDYFSAFVLEHSVTSQLPFSRFTSLLSDLNCSQSEIKFVANIKRPIIKAVLD